MGTTITTTPIDLSPDATSLAAAQANQLASSQQMAAQQNANLKAIYLTAFSNWCLNVNAGRIPNTNPPQPPTQYVVGSPDHDGFQWPVVDPAGAAVCAMPPIPPDQSTPVTLTPNTVDVGHWITGNWYSPGPQNTFSASNNNGVTPPTMVEPGDTGPAADGKPHTFQFYTAPVGQGWYLMLS